VQVGSEAKYQLDSGAVKQVMPVGCYTVPQLVSVGVEAVGQ
jgi:hypothetical protein